MERFLWVRVGVVAVAVVSSGVFVSVASRGEPWPRSLAAGVGQQAFGFAIAALCYLSLVRTLLGSVVAGAVLGGLCWWWAAGMAVIGPESGLLLLAALLVSPVPVLAVAGAEAIVADLWRWRA